MDRRTATHPKPTEQVATRVTPETYESLKAIAAREHRSVAAQVRYLIEAQVDGEKEAA
jgi:hypothetical protein